MKKPFEIRLGWHSSNRLTAAGSYIEAGAKVVLTHGINAKGRCTCGSARCEHPGKHPLAPFFPHGANSATEDIALVRRALKLVPDANIAVVLDQLTVLDPAAGGTRNPKRSYSVRYSTMNLFRWSGSGPYIPRFGLTLLAGDPGRGKSLLTSLLVGILTSGLCWPLSEETCSGRRVLVLSAEDNWQHVTLARVLKAGAKLNNLHRMYKFRALTPERLDRLRQEISAWQPELVIIDTLSAYMGSGRDMHRQNEVGEFLAELTEIAESAGCGILAIAHLNKQSGEHPIYRVVGSIGFMASIRSALFFGSDPDNENRLALAHGKSNAAPKGRTIIFETVGGGRDDVPTLKPVSFSDATERDVCRVERNEVGRPDDRRQVATEFVLEYLRDKRVPVTWEKVLSAAERRNIASAGTLNNVRTQLAKAGKIIQLGRARKARWKLVSEDEDE